MIGLQRVGVVAEYRQALRRRSAHGAETAGRVRNVSLGRHAHHPAAQFLQQLLDRAEVLDGLDRSRTHHDVGLAIHNGLGQGRDVASVVLVVGVGVDDHVSTRIQTGPQAVHEATCQTLVASVAHHMVHPMGQRHFHRVVGAAVIDDQPFHLVEAGHLSGQLSQGDAKRGGFVVAGDLDDELQGVLRSRWLPSAQRPEEGNPLV